MVITHEEEKVMGLGNLMKGGAAVKADMDWNSGDPDRQKKAINTWMGLVGIGEGSQLAVDRLHQLTNEGVTQASNALKHAYRHLAEKAAKKEDVGLAEFLVVEVNNGWDEAERAIDKTLNERAARKGKDKEIRNYKVYAQAGYAPAIVFLNEIGVEY